jgi:elongation factor P
MLSPSDFKKGAIVEIDGVPCRIEKVVVQTPSSRGATTIYKVRARNLKTKQKVDKSFRGGDMVPEPNFERRPVQHLYKDGDSAHFMDTKDYNQFFIPLSELEEEAGYLVDNLEGITALLVDGEVIGIDLPLVVEMAIAECDPAFKGNSATARTKSATLASGLVIQIPEHLSMGEVVRVEVATGKFVGRANR